MEIGIDVVEVKRFKKLISNERFLRKVFSKKEIDYCNSFKNKEERYASRFAVKEAYIKCIDKKNIPHLNKIEVVNSKDGKPSLYVDGKKVRCKISISHTKDYAVAVCILY